MTVIIRAELIGSRTAIADGIRVDASAPILALCRKLISQGYDPGRKLLAYRGDTLCLTVRSLAAGARLAIREDRGPPEFCAYKAPQHGGLAPPVEHTDLPAIHLTSGEQ